MKKGFTLIELLVVIAIIGILSSVVVAALGSSRGKGSDAGVQSNLRNIQTQAHIYANLKNNAFGVANGTSVTAAQCSTANSLFADSSITNMLASARAASKGKDVRCASNASAYIVVAAVNGTSTASTYWCTDSLGTSKYLFAIPGGMICP